MQCITFWDYLLLPLYLYIIYQIAFRIRDTYYPESHPWRSFFIRGLTLKIGGSIFIALTYQYYYMYGDTLQYFFQANVLNHVFSESPGTWVNLMLHNFNWYDGEYQNILSQAPWFYSPSTAAVLTASALIGAFTFNTFLPTSIIFAAISYTGVWALFRTFAVQYPRLQRPVALAVLYIPSTFVWGSGIFKDTICMFALGWLTYGVFQVMLRRNFGIRNILITAAGFYIVAIVKIYILLAFIPALLLWVLFTYSHRIQAGLIRGIVKWSVIGLMAVTIPIALSSFSEELGKYSLDNVVQTSEITRNYLEKVNSQFESTSGYSLGEFDPSPLGMLKKLPVAVNVSLFRPYLWEARKPIVFLNAMEAAIFLLVTLKLIFVLGPVRIWKAINGDPNIQFCLVFTIIFAFAVGISTYNFGSLSRYRIPCLPMFGMSLVLIYYKYKDPEQNILSLS